MKKFLVGWFAAIMVVLILGTCKHKPDVIPYKKPTDTIKPPVDTTHTSTCSPDTVYFTNNILPMIISNCAMAGCHDAITHAEGLNLTSYSQIMKHVSAGNPNGSRLYQSMTGGDDIMPPAGPLSQAQLDAFKKWIAQGAKNNSCNDGGGPCDSLNISYSSKLAPIINNYCKGCHNSSTSSGGVNMDYYNGVLTVANNGQLMGGLTGKLSAMPKYSQPLSSCNISKFRQWIKEGAKNN